MSWNPVLRLIKEIKYEFIKKYQDINTYNFETWLELLDNDNYNQIFKPLQFNQVDEFILIRYGVAEMQRGFWEDKDSIYRECRSVVIDLKKEELVLTPFKKFFNVDEVDENRLEVIRDKFTSASIVEVADKLDGSMQNARWYDGRVFMAGSMALDFRNSWRLKEGYRLLTDKHIAMLKNNSHLTFTFEYISHINIHVIPYKEKDEGLYIIGIRNSDTGVQMSYRFMEAMGDAWGVKTVKTEKKSLSEILKNMKTLKSNEKEGWVINLDGHLVKIKCDDYVHIHRILDKTASNNVVIKSIADGSFDDLISKIPHDYRDRVLKISELVCDYIETTEKMVMPYYMIAPKDNKKKFMIWIEDNVPADIRKYVRSKYLGDEVNYLKSRSGKYIKMSEINRCHK